MATNEADLGGRLFPGGESQRGLGSDPANTPQAPELGAQVLESATTQNTTPSVEAHPPGFDRRGFLRIGLGVGAALGATALGRLIIPGLSSDGDGSGDGGGSSSQPILTGETPTTQVTQSPVETATSSPTITPDVTPTPEVAKEKTSLKEAATVLGIDFGTQINPNLAKEPFSESLVKREFNSISPSVFSWDWVYKNGFDNPNYTLVDKWYSFARQNGMKFRGHALFNSTGNPEWFQKGQFSREQMLDMMNIHAERHMGKYPEIKEWVVTNEPIWSAKGTTGFQQSPFYNVLGPDWIEEAFDIARKKNPNAKLIFNSPGIETQTLLSDEVFRIVSKLKAKGLVDMVGMENHIKGGLGADTWNIDPKTFSSISVEDLIKQHQRYSSIGVETTITELDVDKSRLIGTSDEIDAHVADIYSKIITAAVKSGNCNGITVWGYNSEYSWLNDRGGNGGLLFATNQPTKAYVSSLRTLNELANA